MGNEDKIILDLCGGTGAWSLPYRNAGYDVRLVTLPHDDVFSFHPPAEGVYGILAAPPCRHFSLALVDPNVKEPRNMGIGLGPVAHCLRIIWEAQLIRPVKFWAMENPVGKLRLFMGTPAMTFDPSDYGARYRKRTDLWGNFSRKLIERPAILEWWEKTDVTKSHERFPPLPEGYVLPAGVRPRTARRSITPAGFAEAFFEANP